jgi:hypothetical protein
MLFLIFAVFNIYFSVLSVAPAMPPVCKVMSRFPHSAANDNNDVHQSISFGGFVVENNITSPISKINFAQCFVES